MKSRRVRNLLLATVLLILMGAAFKKLASHPVVRCYLVRWSDLDQIVPTLYVVPDMPAAQRQALLSSIADARKRVATLYGGTIADPVIIAGHTMAVMKVYGGSADNRAGKTYFTPVAAYIVLGSNGISDLDVLAHELAHAEWVGRIGYWNRKRVPNWFEEGLAVQFDSRYLEAEWQSRADSGRAVPDLDQVPVIQHDDWLGYATAKHEVSRWLDIECSHLGGYFHLIMKEIAIFICRWMGQVETLWYNLLVGVPNLAESVGRPNWQDHETQPHRISEPSSC